MYSSLSSDLPHPDESFLTRRYPDSIPAPLHDPILAIGDATVDDYVTKLEKSIGQFVTINVPPSLKGTRPGPTKVILTKQRVQFLEIATRQLVKRKDSTYTSSPRQGFLVTGPNGQGKSFTCALIFEFARLNGFIVLGLVRD
jgi:hypothetical protein